MAKMKADKLAWRLAVVTVLLAPTGLAQEPPLQRLSLNDLKVNRLNGTIALTISCDAPTRLWDESYSWGATLWRVHRIRNGQTETFYQSPYQIFPRNFPAFETITPGTRLERTLNLNGGNWCWLGQCTEYDEHGFHGRQVSFKRGDLIIVVYDVPLTDEAHQRAVWHGVVAASITVR